MDTTTYLAIVIGWYLVILSVFLLLRSDQLQTLVSEFFAQRVLLFVVALFTLILGLLMVTSHNVWVLGWPVVVTLLCWLVLISGIIRLFFPDCAMKMGEYFLEHPERMKVATVIYLLIGLFLLYKAYWS